MSETLEWILLIFGFPTAILLVGAMWEYILKFFILATMLAAGAGLFVVAPYMLITGNLMGALSTGVVCGLYATLFPAVIGDKFLRALFDA